MLAKALWLTFGRIHLIEMTVVDIQAFIEILLGYNAVRCVKDLATVPIVFEGLSNGIRQFTTWINVSDENIRLKFQSAVSRKITKKVRIANSL